jgi:nicotinamide-nucleotide amidase
MLRTWGESESRIAEIVGDLYHTHTNPTLAFLASGGEIKLRLTARAATPGAAADLIAPVEAEIRRRLGRLVFATGADTIERIVLRLCAERGWTLATAESATGGLVSAALTSVPGSSEVVRGGIVAYHPELKTGLLGVDPAILDGFGLVSAETALAMAAGARRALGADVAVAVTGSAGPDALEQPVGTMVIAVETPEGSRARGSRSPGDRERVRVYTTTAALHLLRLGLTGEWWSR